LEINEWEIGGVARGAEILRCEPQKARLFTQKDSVIVMWKHDGVHRDWRIRKRLNTEGAEVGAQRTQRKTGQRNPKLTVKSDCATLFPF
jgi:hypothetical protein